MITDEVKQKLEELSWENIGKRYYIDKCVITLNAHKS